MLIKNGKNRINLDEAKKTKGKSNLGKLLSDQQREKNKKSEELK